MKVRQRVQRTANGTVVIEQREAEAINLNGFKATVEYTTYELGQAPRVRLVRREKGKPLIETRWANTLDEIVDTFLEAARTEQLELL